MNNTGKWSIHSYPFTVLETHVDSLDHMNNVYYLQVFEEARWQMITDRGYGSDVIKSLQTGPVILSIEIQFLKEILLRQKMEIKSFGVAYEGKVGKLRQQMFSESGDLHCQADFKIGLFDIKARKLIHPTKEWLKACGDLT